MIPRGQITGLILAGGRGTRMGGLDKGLQDFAGRPLVKSILERFAPQVGPLLISANRHREAYEAFGYPVIADRVGDFSGPLAGLHAGLTACATPYLVCTPCDSPRLPEDLVRRLGTALERSGAPVAYARCGAQVHPVFLLCRRDVVTELEKDLATDQRRIVRWCSRLGAVTVDFADEAAFANINTVEELAAR